MTVSKKIRLNTSSKSAHIKFSYFNNKHQFNGNNNIKKFNKKYVKIIRMKNNEFMGLKFDRKFLKAPRSKPVSSLVNKNDWKKVLPNSCKVNPLYFTSTYPWTYRMSATISNYEFGKKPINNLLTFNINLPIKYQLTGSYFFSNYDTTNYGKLNGKRLPLYRVYPSLLLSDSIQHFDYIYTPAFTNVNLSFLPHSKYFSENKISGNPWFVDNITNTFLRRYHNIYPHNIMSRETDSIISMFDNKLYSMFQPLSTTYNLQRVFTMGLSPTSKVFMPYKYLRSCQTFAHRFNLWSQKYYSFWAKLKIQDLVTTNMIVHLFDLYSSQINHSVYSVNNFVILNKLMNYNSKKHNLFFFNILKKNKVNDISCKNLFLNLKQKTDSLSDNVLRPFSKNKLCINISQGRSLLGNLLFTTRKLAVITSRALYHYYPFYTKKPYGTGIKQTLKTKSIKFNKIKLLNLTQMIQFTNILSHTPSFFNKTQQLSKWMYSKDYISTLFDNKSFLLNSLSLAKNTTYLSKLISNYLGKVAYKTTYQHLMPNSTRWNSFFNMLQLYKYLTKSQYYIQRYKRQSKNKWYRNRNYKSSVNNNFMCKKMFLNWNIQNLNDDVQQFIYNEYPDKRKYLAKKINSLKKLYGGDSNWLKYYIDIPQRINIYNKWINFTLQNWSLPEVYSPQRLINEPLLITGVNKWLNTHFDFYKNYNELVANLNCMDNIYVRKLLDSYNMKSTFNLIAQPQVVDNFNKKMFKTFNVPIVFSLLDKTLVLKSRLYKFIQTKFYKNQIKVFKQLFNQALVVKPQYDIKENWEIPLRARCWTLTLSQWKNILRKKKGLWFSGYNNNLTPIQQYEKEIYLKYDKELQLYMKKYLLEQQRLEQQRLLTQKLEQQKLEQQRLEQQKLKEERLEQQKLKEEKKNMARELVHVPLGVKMPPHVWRVLEPWQQTEYHIHQKRLKKEAKRLGLPIPVSPSNSNPHYTNKNKNKI